ncbi:MAG: DUF6261 family protein [Tannerellaceae bacterium]|jgi:hypothetical protein|nr:DUF6261 family protein [Tannerellaceae bacterium]
MKFIKNYLSLLKRLRNGEHFDFYGNIIDFMNGREQKTPALLPLWNTFRTLYDTEDEIYKRSLKAVETKYIDEADSARIDTYMGIKRKVKFMTFSTDPQEAAAAQTLMEVIENYKNINRSALTEKTSLIINMVQDFDRPRYSAAVTTLQLISLIDKLEQENSEFKVIYTERTQHLNEEKSLGNMYYIRPKVDKAFSEFTEAVNAFYKTNELLEKDVTLQAALADIIQFVNSYISQYERIYARRNPKYTNGNGKNPDITVPDTQVSRFTVIQQEVSGNSSVIPGFGTHMSLEIENPTLFAQELYPVAQDGVLHLWDDSSNNESFPITGFLTNSETSEVTGLIVKPSSTDMAFNKPFQETGKCKAEILKDGEQLAILNNVGYPATMTEG